METTATELKLNLGKYLEAANDEVIVITKNGKEIAKLIGSRTFKYDFSELEELERQMKGGAMYSPAVPSSMVLGEAPAAGYGTKPGAESEGGPEADIWVLTRNGKPVAKLEPVLKEKPKRKLGFMHGPPDSPETIAALFEPIMTDEEYERWLNKNYD